MIKYPRIYSFSTVGVVMHYNQDYLLHHIRTDFTGRNGIGKSLIADLFQLLFIADKKKITFGTDSIEKSKRDINTLPYNTPDAYVFVNIEFEKDNFITFGINIPNKKSRPLKSFWILNKPYGINDDLDLIDLAIEKENIPTFKDFTTNDIIPPIEKLAIQLRENKGIYLKAFTDKSQKSELFTFLYEKEILPINLSVESNLSAYAKVIQSFSKAKTLNTKNDKSLKDFLFDDSIDSFESNYKQHKAELEKLITDYKELEELILDIEHKDEKLSHLNVLKNTYLDTYENHIFTEYFFIKKELKSQEKKLETINKQVKDESEKIRLLKVKNPKTEITIEKAIKNNKALKNDLEKLKTYKISFDKLQQFEEEKTKLKAIKIPDVRQEPKETIEIQNYEFLEIQRRIKKFNKVYSKFQSIEKIEAQIEAQTNTITAHITKLKNKKNDTNELITLISKNTSGTIFSKLFSDKHQLSEAEETVLMFAFKDLYWKKPKEIIAGIRYVENLAFLSDSNITKDEEHNGYWFNLNGVKQFVPKSNDKQLFGNKEQLNKVFKKKKTKLELDISAIDKELAQLDNFIKGKSYDIHQINLEYDLDQSLKDFSALEELKIGLAIIQNLEVKRDHYENLINQENILLSQLAKEIKVRIDKDGLDAQIEKLSVNLDESKEFEKGLTNTLSADVASLSEKQNFLPNLLGQPKELENSIKLLTDDLNKIINKSNSHFPNIELKNLDKQSYLSNDREDKSLIYQKAERNYITDYKAIIQFFEQIKNDTEIKEQVVNETFNFDTLELTLLGPKIKHTDNLVEALKQANNSRQTMFGMIHQTMLSIFKQTKGKFDEYERTIRKLNKFFKGKKISDKYYFQIVFNTPNQFKIDWINKLQASSQEVYNEGQLTFGDSVEDFVEDFFIKATGMNERIKFSNLLDPKTYFELNTKFTDEFQVEKPGSTGESYTAIVLLGIGRLSVVLDAKRKGLRFLILEEVSNLDTSNFSTFPTIAEEFGYQILTMTPRPYGSDTDQGWYLHHLIEGALDKNINYPIPNSYYKTNEGSKELSLHLKNN